MLRDTLKTLCALRGPSGWEDQVREYLIDRLRGSVDEMRVDALGNLICFKKGAVSAPNRLMICAHMDEVGLMITRIDSDGYLHFGPVGGIDRRVLLSKPVLVGEKAIPGVIGLKPIHLTTPEDRESIPKYKELCIDIGAQDREAAEALVAPGDYATFLPESLEFGEDMLKSKAIDDRIGCAVMVELLERELPMDVTCVFTVQEEIGTRGAFGAGFSVRPEIALILEGTTAADSPAMPESKKVCAPGKGPVIPYMDRASIVDRGLFETLRGICEANAIPWQTKEYLSGGTDAGTIQRSRAGVRVCGVSAAVRYLHAPTSVASLADCDHMLTLAALFLEEQAREIKGGQEG